MDPIIIAALLLLQSLAPQDYQRVIEHPIQVVESQRCTPPGESTSGAGCTFHGDPTIYLVAANNPTDYFAAGTLVHEDAHLRDRPKYADSWPVRIGVDGNPRGREALAMLAQVKVLKRVGAPANIIEWAERLYWQEYWKEVGRQHRSLGIIPWLPLPALHVGEQELS